MVKKGVDLVDKSFQILVKFYNKTTFLIKKQSIIKTNDLNQMTAHNYYSMAFQITDTTNSKPKKNLSRILAFPLFIYLFVKISFKTVTPPTKHVLL